MSSFRDGKKSKNEDTNNSVSDIMIHDEDYMYA